MKHLKEEQRKMRERVQATQRKKTITSTTSTKSSSHAEPSETKDVQTLLKRIEALEAENTLLRRQLSALRDQPLPQERRPGMSESERQHLFMKYSNVRRY
jgi:hypothetical protein